MKLVLVIQKKPLTSNIPEENSDQRIPAYTDNRFTESFVFSLQFPNVIVFLAKMANNHSVFLATMIQIIVFLAKRDKNNVFSC